REGTHQLESSGHAEASHLLRAGPGDVGAIHEDTSVAGRIEAGDAVEERGFSGSVGADQSHDLASAERETDLLVGEQSAKALGEPSPLQQRAHALPPAALRRISRRSRHARTPPTIPSG